MSGDTGTKSYMNKHLWELDQELFKMIQDEKSRQKEGLEMIASENYTSLSVMECLGSCLSNKYSEGLPGARYYGGNEFIDKIEILAQKRSLATFSLDASEWGVNVQPYSGSPANFAVYTAVVEPHGRIMGLDLPDGGHLTHGFFTAQKKVSATSIFFESMPYKVDPQTGLIDYDQLAQSARLFRPKVIIAGVSCYSRVLDYKRFRAIADECGAYLMADMSHVSGLVAAKVIPSPFDYCDIVTTTTHKTLRGPRSGVIFFRKGVKQVKASGEKMFYDLESRINAAVFPSLQGGPHNHQIAGIALCMAQAQTDEFINYQQQVVKNAKALCEKLQEHGYKISAGGTDVHLLLVNLKSTGLSGGKAEFILDEVNIACNKNTVPGDASALNPSGIRLGTPALTTRGLKEEDFSNIADFIDAAVKLGLEIQKRSGPKLVEFKRVALEEFEDKIEKLRNEVKEFALRFPLPGHDNY